MGTVCRIRPVGQRFSAGFCGKGEHLEGPKHRRSVDLVRTRGAVYANQWAEGELVDLIEEFSDGRIQFAYVKVKDPNTTLPKNALIAWCGEGVPERTKGYFMSHLSAVSKILHVCFLGRYSLRWMRG